MKKINKLAYERLLIQAQEARQMGLIKLADSITQALTPNPEDESVEDVSYSFAELEDDIHNGMWKLATNIIKYYNLHKVDAEVLDSKIESFASNFQKELCEALKVDYKTIGPFDQKLPGQK